MVKRKSFRGIFVNLLQWCHLLLGVGGLVGLSFVVDAFASAVDWIPGLFILFMIYRGVEVFCRLGFVRASFRFHEWHPIMSIEFLESVYW
jgi:hypothetical protein